MSGFSIFQNLKTIHFGFWVKYLKESHLPFITKKRKKRKKILKELVVLLVDI
jgi:hypothetical protein